MAWKARNKIELMIEVWERLDCESVGAAEIEAIGVVVEDTFGRDAVDSPMVIARVLADEGATLRHPEIMGLYVKRAGGRRKSDRFQDLLHFDDLRSTLSSLGKLERLRADMVRDNDRHGLRAVREAAIRSKDHAVEKAKAGSTDAETREIHIEVAEWLRVWLQTPELFGGWVKLRVSSKDFLDKFGPI